MARRASVVLLLIGLLCIAYVAAETANARRYQREALAALATTSTDEAPIAPTRRARLRAGDPIGRLEIPRLDLSAAVAEGDDDGTLKKAIGHLPDTPLPWELRGNTAFAAHRDGLFRRLENIRLGDEIRLHTPRGVLRYRVDKTHIVDPEDVWVLAPTPDPSLTLITCYPFRFIGSAPQRFIVHAEIIDDFAGPVVKGRVLD